MCNVKNEIEQYKKSSKMKMRFIINIYKLIRFLNGDLFYFIYTLSFIIVPIILINFTISGIVIGLILHHLVFNVLVKKRLDRLFNVEKDNQEMTEVINSLQDFLNKKPPKK